MIDTIDVKDYTNGGKCSNCGQCCSNLLPLSDGEIKAIKAHIKKHHIKEQRHNAMNGIDMTCPFRDEKSRKCLIYEVRPQICRLFKCDQCADEIAGNKLRMHNVNKVTIMRYEFFGSKEDLNFILKGANDGQRTD